MSRTTNKLHVKLDKQRHPLLTATELPSNKLSILPALIPELVHGQMFTSDSEKQTLRAKFNKQISTAIQLPR